MLAALIDLLIQGTVMTAAAFSLAVFFSAAGTSGTVAIVVLLLIVTAVFLGYPIAFETLWRGRTPGKAALGLRVVTREGAPVRFRHAAVRGFVGLVDFWLTSAAAAVIAVLVSADNQRLGDLAAGTLVLRERSGAGRPTSMQFPVPHGYEAYTATLDVAGLTPDEYGAVRSFLLRAGSLPAAVRARLGAELASTVADRMHHTPPPGVAPEAFLACLAAASQRRGAVAAPAPPPSQVWAPAADVWGAATSAPQVPAAASPAAAAPADGFVPPP